MENLPINLSFAERLIVLCDKILSIMEWDIEKEQADWDKNKSRRIYADEKLKQTTYKAKLEANLSHGLGISSLYNMIDGGNYMGWTSYFGYKSAEDFTVQSIEDQRTFAYLILDIIQLYNDWKAAEFDPEIKDISARLGNKESADVDPELLRSINNLVVKGTFKAYKYRDGGDSIGLYDTFHISEVIGFSSDLTMWLDHVQKQEDFLSQQAEDKVFVTLFGKLDEVHPIYSNWLFTMHKGKTIWIVTDHTDFDNPYQKRVRLERRSVWRDRYETYDNCDLPYDLFHQIDELKAKNTALTKNNFVERIEIDSFKSIFTGFGGEIGDYRDKCRQAESIVKAKLDSMGISYTMVYTSGKEDNTWGHEIYAIYVKRDGHTVAYAHEKELILYNKPEVFFKGLLDITPGQNTFCVLLIKEIIKYLASNVETPKIMLAHEHLSMKLLEGAKIDPVKNKSMEHWSKPHQKIFMELAETLEHDLEVSNALQVQTYEVVKSSTYYDASWLTTPDKLSSLAEWTVLEDKANLLRPKVRELSKTRQEAGEWLEQQFETKYSQIVKKVTQSAEMVFIGKAYGSWDDGSKSKGKKKENGYVIGVKKKIQDASGIGKKGWKKEVCPCCGEYLSKAVKKIHIRHYKELMWLLDITDRKEMPRYYQNFRSHDLVPYAGNSLLDQTHPYLRIQDPLSRREPNGLNFYLFMCGNCYKKIKQPMEKLAVELDIW